MSIDEDDHFFIRAEKLRERERTSHAWQVVVEGAIDVVHEVRRRRAGRAVVRNQFREPVVLVRLDALKLFVTNDARDVVRISIDVRHRRRRLANDDRRRRFLSRRASSNDQRRRRSRLSFANFFDDQRARRRRRWRPN